MGVFEFAQQKALENRIGLWLLRQLLKNLLGAKWDSSDIRSQQTSPYSLER